MRCAVSSVLLRSFASFACSCGFCTSGASLSSLRAAAARHRRSARDFACAHRCQQYAACTLAVMLADSCM